MVHRAAQARNRHLLPFDLLFFATTPLLAWWMVEQGDLGSGLLPTLLVLTGTFGVLKAVFFFSFKLYKRYWQYASVDELAILVKVGVLLTAVQALLLVGVLQPLGLVAGGVPAAVAVLDGLFTVLLSSVVRYGVRLADHSEQTAPQGTATRRVLVAGAGVAGLRLVEDMQTHPALNMTPVAFVDDHPAKYGKQIRGLQVLGDRHAIPQLAERLDVDLVVIAMPNVSGAIVRDIVGICRAVGVAAQVVPSAQELMRDDATTRLRPRDVRVEDLLRRPVVVTDTTALRALVAGKTVLVTGAGGSIGSEICRHVLRMEPACLVLLGHGENSIFRIEQELRQREAVKTGRTKLVSTIADIRHRERLTPLFEAVQPDLVLHAAAHKHVPLMEANVEEAILNNVFGTRTLVELCEAYDVHRFVLISSDKAVCPTNVMGATKRIAEMIVRAAAERTGRSFTAVRFGNVLGSRGSVLEVFRRQIDAGGPVTVTHPDVERYFMTIPEAVQLVLQAAAMAEGGERFVLDMGRPVKIIDLARDLLRLQGLREGIDVDVVFSGLRPGEKMSESLFDTWDDVERTCHVKILRSCSDDGDAYPDRQLQIEELIRSARRSETDDVLRLIKELVPTFKRAAAGPRTKPVVAPLAQAS